jgi:anti-sigma regulatory factor (Ser/Thr protein kinase)
MSRSTSSFATYHAVGADKSPCTINQRVSSHAGCGYTTGMVSRRPQRPPDVDVSFENDPKAPSRARRAIRPLVDRPDDPIAEAVTLTTSELVTNTILHTADGGNVRAWDPQPDVPLRLEVEDHDATMPQRRQPDDGRPGGRGLHIVDGLADDWGVDRTPTGKIVWAEFDRDQHE